MVTISYQVDPDKQFQKALTKAIAEVDDLRIPFQLIAQSWFKSNKAIFSLSGPGKYKDLADSTKKFKIRHIGTAYPILKLTGRLESSMTDPTSSDSINLIVNKNSLYLGTKVPYAIYHQSPEPRSKIPFRPMVLLGAEQVSPPEINRRREAWIATIENYVTQVTSKLSSGGN